MAKPSKKLSKTVEAKVLIACRRRCCLCWSFENDASQKDGQITFIDRNRSNASEENLVYLCLRHHNEYDSVESRARNITSEEVLHARTELLRSFGSSQPLSTLSLKLSCEVGTFSDEDAERILGFLKKYYRPNSELEMVVIEPGGAVSDNIEKSHGSSSSASARPERTGKSHFDLRSRGNKSHFLEKSETPHVVSDQKGGEPGQNENRCERTSKVSEHLLNKAARCFDRPTLEAIANLSLDADVLLRLDELAVKANEGLLTEDERSDYRSYIETSEFLALVQLRARQQLGLPVGAE